MQRPLSYCLAVLWFATSATVWAEDLPNAVARRQLALKVTAPIVGPALPSSASTVAVQVHADIAFGQRGEAMKAIHAQVGSAALRAAESSASNVLPDGANERSSEGASNSAAGQARAAAARGKVHPGEGPPSIFPPQGPGASAAHRP